MHQILKDQVTESIIDTALLLGKPFAVVPCCVFPNLFPERKIMSKDTTIMKTVTSYEEFIQYLVAKSSVIKLETLPFKGRNIVLFSLPSADSAKSRKGDYDRIQLDIPP